MKRKGQLVGLSGRAGSGKDTVADMLDGYERVSFAEPLKAIAADINPMIGEVRLRHLLDHFGWDEAKRHPEVRGLLQRLGSSARKHLDQGVWVRPAMQKADRLLKDGVNVVITDMRHVNEAEAVAKRGGLVVRIERTVPHLDHETESNLDDYDFDLTILNNGTLEDLAVEVEGLLESLSAQGGSGTGA